MHASLFFLNKTRKRLAGHIALQFQHAGGLTFNFHIPKEGKRPFFAPGRSSTPGSRKNPRSEYFAKKQAELAWEMQRGRKEKNGRGETLRSFATLNRNRFSAEGITLGMG